MMSFSIITGSVLPKNKVNVTNKKRFYSFFFYNIFAFFENTVFYLKKCVGSSCQNLLKFGFWAFYVVPQEISTSQSKIFGLLPPYCPALILVEKLCQAFSNLLFAPGAAEINQKLY